MALLSLFTRVYIRVIHQAWGQNVWILDRFSSAFLLTQTDFMEVDVNKNAKKNEASIQPPWPHKLGQ